MKKPLDLMGLQSRNVSMSSINILNMMKVVIIIVMLFMEAELLIANTSCVEKERRALRKMKEAFVDDYALLSSWGCSVDCCEWRGVHCNPHNGHVEMLDLHGDQEGWQPLRGEISPSLMDLQHLIYLNMSFNDFNGSHIPKFIASLTKLTCLDLFGSDFGGEIPIELGRLSHLRLLNLSSNVLVGNIPFHLANLSSLQELRLYGNHLVGNIPSQLGNLSSLRTLWIGGNDGLKIDDNSLVGFEWLSNLWSLTALDLSDVSNFNYSNNLFPILGKLPNLRVLWLQNCSLTDMNILSTPPSHLNFSSSLVSLGLTYNKLTSSIFPWLFNLSSNLAYLYLYGNHLGGPFPVDFATHMNSLVVLYLSDNELNGTISDVHFHNFTKLKSLDLSLNLLSLKFSNNWIPPFQLQELRLLNCKLGPGFPRWLRTQNNIQELYVSHAEINDSVPEWFWRVLGGADILHMESSNLTGSIPLFLLKSGFLELSGNQFSKFVPPCAKGIRTTFENLQVLNLSSNNLSGDFSDCWDQFKSLKVLDVSNNQLLGRIPNSISSLNQLEQLVLRNNCLSGGLPSLENATKLGMLDMGKNELTGPIPPSWRRKNLKELETLSLRKNKLDGKLPSHLCYLTKLRVLDLSFNKFTGPIPSCLDQLHAMTLQTHAMTLQMHFIHYSSHKIDFFQNGSYQRGKRFNWFLPMMWKGIELVYTDRFGLLNNIDLSHNQLVGEMPTGIGKLVGLRSLNLSSNNLSGKIIPKIGQLRLLEALDLSRNHFDGEIPVSLVEISFLNTLDLSNNNLSGQIPIGIQLQSFTSSSYEGNPFLCGMPLDKLCSSEDHPFGNGTEANQTSDEDEPFMKGFYESLGVGFGVGFWIVFGSLLVIRSWRHAYFRFVSKVSDSIYVTTMLLLARWRRWSVSATN